MSQNSRFFQSKTAYFLFFLSGFTSLIFEVVWAKKACLIFGNTSFASAAVVSAFMCGLALGSYVIGRGIASFKHSPLLIYGAFEAGVGIFAISFPLWTFLFDSIYRVIYPSLYQHYFLISCIRFSFSLLLLVVPTFLMGATLPLLTQYFLSRSEGHKPSINKLYSFNLAGAVVGTLSAGFILLPMVGIAATSYFAATVNFLIFGSCFLIHKKESKKNNSAISGNAILAVDNPYEMAFSPLGNIFKIRFILALAFIQGFVSFAYQMLWMRMAALVNGSSTYAFSMVLGVFLLGLAIASTVYTWRSRKSKEPSIVTSGTVLFLSGFLALLTVPFFAWTIFACSRWSKYIYTSFGTSLGFEFLFVFLSLIIPVSCLGLVLPSLLRFAEKEEKTSEFVGKIYACNTLGAVVGAFAAPFVLVPLLGIAGCLRLISFIAILGGIGTIFYFVADYQKKRAGIFVSIFAWMSLILFFYPWDKNVFSSGPFIYADSLSSYTEEGMKEFREWLKEGQTLLYYKDGPSSTVSVYQFPVYNQGSEIPAKSLKNNGKVDASTIGDMTTQIYCAYLPLVAHPNPKEVLVIGMGSGCTAGTVAQFKNVQSVDVVEIEPAVVKAAELFKAENYSVLSDPRVHVIIGDGRNHLSFSDKTYDVIISEPSNPWISGISNLFTIENYEEALKKLKAGGIYCQWFHSYQMSEDDFLMIINTFCQVFPKAQLYSVNTADYLLLGSKEDIEFDFERVFGDKATQMNVRKDLSLFARQLDFFMPSTFVWSDGDMRAFLSEAQPQTNTDDRLILEYSAPKNLYNSEIQKIENVIDGYDRKQILMPFKNNGGLLVGQSPFAWKVFYADAVRCMRGKRFERAVDSIDKALMLDPNNQKIQFYQAIVYEGAGRFNDAVEIYEKLLNGSNQWTQRAGAGLRRAKIRQRMEESPILKRDTKGHNIIAGLSFYMGDKAQAIESIETAIALDPGYLKNYEDSVTYLYSSGKRGQVQEFIEKAEKIYGPAAEIKNAKLLLERFETNIRNTNKFMNVRQLIKDKKYKEAKVMLLEIQQRTGPTYEIEELLANCERGLGNKEAAKTHDLKAADLAKSYSSAQDMLSE